MAGLSFGSWANPGSRGDQIAHSSSHHCSSDLGQSMRGPETSAVPELEVHPSAHVTTRRNTTGRNASFRARPRAVFLAERAHSPLFRLQRAIHPTTTTSLCFSPSQHRPSFVSSSGSLMTTLAIVIFGSIPSRASAVTPCTAKVGKAPVSAALPRCPPLSRGLFLFGLSQRMPPIKLIGQALDFRAVTCRALVGPTVPTLAGNGSIVLFGSKHGAP